MAIFSRRTLQYLIDENCSFFKKRQTKKLVQQLNHMPDDLTLAAEWEVVIINALSKIGNVSYERNFGGNRNADVYFETLNNSSHNFLSDITTVSDKGLDASNPFEALWDELDNKVKAHGLNPNCFSLQVNTLSSYNGSSKYKLKIPGRARFSQTIFGEDFNKFIENIFQKSKLVNNLKIKSDDVDLEIGYNPNQRYASGDYPNYKSIYSLTENTIYQALESKASQLIGTGFTGPIGVFLCDGGCIFLKNKPLRGLTSRLEDIINIFLNNNKEIYFIVTFSIWNNKKIKSFKRGLKHYSPVIRLFPGEKFNQIKFDFKEILEKLPGVFPSPQQDPINALNLLKGKYPNIGRPYWGGLEVTCGKERMKIKISARAILELLAGKIEQKEFSQRYEFFGTGKNPFEIALDQGQLIQRISMEKSASDDDDWISIELEGPDPAISPFIVPKN